MFKRNVAVTGFGIGHFIGVADGIAVTTGTPTCKRTLDGTGGACANAAAYNTEGAVWTIDLTAGDMNADVVVLSFTLAGCIPISYTIKTVTKLVSELVDAAAAPSASDNATATAAAILVTPANKLATSATGEASANVTLWKDATAPAMTGDAFARLGAPAGASVSADIAAIAAASAAGSGAISFPVTINDESSNPIDGVEVWVSTDSAGASVVAGTLHTSALGVATFMLDAGTYYLWRQKSGYNFTNPVTITVS